MLRPPFPVVFFSCGVGNYLADTGDGVGEDMLPSAKDYVMPAPPGFMLRE